MKFLFLTTFVFCISFLSQGAEAKKPNILIILADDMGYGDMQFTGSQHLRTPHLDALAESGVFCEQAYVASPVCSPSRAGLITGRDPRRFGYENNLNKGSSNYPTRPELLGLPPGEHTLADHLGAAGYRTGLIGKWHLGTGPEFHPNKRGFDHFCGMLTGSHSYFPTRGKHQLERNGVALEEFSSEYLTDFFTDEIISFMEVNDETPWFLFASYNAPHGPMHATEEDLAHFAHIADEKRRTFAAMMFALDRGVGRIRSALKDLGELENTLIVFFSDNGGATSNASWNGPLSGAKGTLLEGGIRIPMIWSQPGTIPAGQRTATPVSALDLLPTFLAAADASPLPLREPLGHEDKRNFRKELEKSGPYDGVNLLPLFQGEPIADRTLFWRLQGQASILAGGDKLIRPSHRPAQLFTPASDPGERNDLSSEKAERMADLYRRLADWEAGLPTVPLWSSSPFWRSESAKHYDTLPPREEPE